MLHAGTNRPRWSWVCSSPSPGAARRSGRPSATRSTSPTAADDRFKVTAWVSGLTPDNAVYQFAATAPGTYQVMDIGRFVRSFEAFDAAGRPVPVEQVSVNQWKLGDAPRVRTIRYSIAETWDTQGGPAPGLPHVRHLDGEGPRADQPARGDRISHRHAGAADPAPDRVPGELEGGHGARARPGRGVPGGGLRPAGGLPDPARPADRGADQGHRRPGARSSPTPRPTGSVGPAAGRDERDAPGRGTVPGQAAGGPLHLPLSLRGPAEREPGSIRSAPSTSSRRASSPIRSAATSPTSRRTSSSTS